MKTIEQASQEYAWPYRGYDFAEAPAKDVEAAFVAGVKFAQRWISVKDELPEKLSCGESKFVLVKNEFGFLSAAYYDYDTDHWVNSITNRYWQKITHWRPIELK
jgi:hypothetical protein